MPSCLQRKYIDLIYRVSTKWVNWDPPIEIPVGTYGTVDKRTGDLLVEGNIYDPMFQGELDRQGVKLHLADFPPKQGPIEGDFIISSRGARHREMNADVGADAPGIATASLKGQWVFEDGKRGAVLVMHNPRQVYLPPNIVLEALYHVDKLIDKWLVTSVQVCPAYSMYLSDGSSGKFSIALVAKAPIVNAVGATADASGGFEWWDSSHAGLHRKGCDPGDQYVFTPLYALKRPVNRFWRLFREKNRPEPKGDDLWYDASPPWDPLDEDGEEDPIVADIQVPDSSTEAGGTKHVV